MFARILNRTGKCIKFLGRTMVSAGTFTEELSNFLDKRRDSFQNTSISSLKVNKEFHMTLLEYDNFISFFIKEKPNALVEKGCATIEIKTDIKKYAITQFFLDKENNPCGDSNVIYGRRICVEEIDDELKNLFGNKNMIVIE